MKHNEHSSLNPALRYDKVLPWLILGVTLSLTIIDNFLKMYFLVGGWHMVIYLLVTIPLLYMIKRLQNPYTKWFLPLLLVMMVDMFYYSNELAQFFVPIVFYLLIGILYLTSMQRVHSLYQTLLPRFALEWKPIQYIGEFLEQLIVFDDNQKILGRIGTALLITFPFLALFIALLFSADTNFSNFLSGLVDFDFGFELRYLVTVPLSFLVYLILFIYGFSNAKERLTMHDTLPFDLLIVTIFLGMINLLFATFLSVQIPFLVGASYLPEGTTLAEFAREGFFQLMMVMGIVTLIFLFIMRRFKGEKMLILFLSGLLIQTIVMGVVSLKKMYLYQSIKGATVLRYYVEWFDYFLIGILVMGIIFLIRKIAFTKLLDSVVVLGLVSFGIVISMDIDYMVASHNIEKFKDTPEELDKDDISYLSIDALPAVKQYDVNITRKVYGHDENSTFYDIEWYKEDRYGCKRFAAYHWGYCSRLKEYGNE